MAGSISEATSWRGNAVTDNAPALSQDALARLLAPIARVQKKPTSRPFFIEVGTSALPATILNGLIPESVVLIFDQADVLSAGGLARVMALNAQGFGLALRNPDRAALARDDGLLSLMTHVEAEFGNPDLAQMVRLAGQAEHLLGVVVNNAADWQEFEVCAELGVMSFFGNLCTAPRQQRQSVQLNPHSSIIVQLMQMVQDNVDVREMEKLLKCDATLSYRLTPVLSTFNPSRKPHGIQRPRHELRPLRRRHHQGPPAARRRRHDQHRPAG